MANKFWGEEKKRSLIFLGIAVAVALVASILSYNWLQKKATVEVKALETQPVVVTMTDLNWGAALNKDMLKAVPYLKDSLPPGSFSDPAALAGRTVLFPMKANEPIFESKLAPIGGKGGVASIVSPTKRAMAVKVDKVVGVAGFIHPGNRLDVLVTLLESKASGKPITKIVLENILVLAVGAELEKPNGKQEKASQVDVLTLEVTPEEGEKLALAATEGKLQMALRNYTDTDEVGTRGTTVPTLLASYLSAGKKSPSSRRVASQPEAFSVEIIKGNKVSAVNVGKGE
jgi:pilus assembly protein CpaB